ncbi:MAG: N-acetyltransferase [Acidobacteriota bacterium]
MITIRAEVPADIPSVRRVNEMAFGRPEEAALVDALRPAVNAQISLVAVDDDQVVGHIFFSPVSIEPEGFNSDAFGLAPMAVLPAYQRQGVGSQLVREGLRECQRVGRNVVVVLGHPDYYPRFGFAAASKKGLHSEYPVPDEVFMVAELVTGALNGRKGLVKYHPKFGEV